MAIEMVDIPRREPVDFAAGDSLIFMRHLIEFPASQGWSLEYALFADTGGPAVANFQSTALADDHSVDIDAFAKGFAAGEYVLAGYAVNGAERHQIYRGEFHIGSDFESGGVVADQTTHAQRMIPLLETKLERLEAMDFSETDVQRNRFVIEQRNQITARLREYKEIRHNELQREAVKNGKTAVDRAVPFFQIG